MNLLTKTLKKMTFSLTKWRMRGLLLNKNRRWVLGIKIKIYYGGDGNNNSGRGVGDNDDDRVARVPRPRLISGYLNSINRDNPYYLINSNTW